MLSKEWEFVGAEQEQEEEEEEEEKDVAGAPTTASETAPTNETPARSEDTFRAPDWMDTRTCWYCRWSAGYDFAEAFFCRSLLGSPRSHRRLLRSRGRRQAYYHTKNFLV